MIYYAVKLMYRICETMLVYVCSAVGIEGTKAFLYVAQNAAEGYAWQNKMIKNETTIADRSRPTG